MKRILVTGGAAGIGFEIARTFVENDARVLVCDVNDEALKNAKLLFQQMICVRCDLAELSDIESLFGSVERDLGGLDVLVNNAGIGGPTLPADRLPSEEWRKVMDVNLTATFEVTRRAIPHLKKTAGTIINMSSAAGRYGYPNRIAYATTKWGLVGFTKTLSMELGEHGITVNAILPGAVAGERYDRVIEGRARLSGTSTEEIIREGLASQSIKRVVDPKHIAELALFLTTEAGRSISGQMLPIDCDLQHG